MQATLIVVFLFSFMYLTHSVTLKTSMSNNYPQIAVLGCGSHKANLYYDIQRHVWVENLVSSCIDDEKSILRFCQKAYPSLNIGNIIRLDTVLSFENWCELIPSQDNTIPRCKSKSLSEEAVQPFRCLHADSANEELSTLSMDCTMNSIVRADECLRAEKWQELATLDCSNKKTMLNSSIIPLEWCGLSQFRGAKFLCCVLKDVDDRNDYETSLAENKAEEDNPIEELLLVPQTTTTETHRRIIAMSLGSREPSWMEDYRRWSSDSGYFADDEDTVDDQEEIKLSSAKKSHLTITEHERFSSEKETFKRKYNQQIDALKSRWQKRQDDLQLLARTNPSEAQKQYEQSEINFRQDYDYIKQIAIRERTRINELHENNLDSILDIAKKETNDKLIVVWNEKPLKTENVKEALYNYIHVLLRDRIHLVNRYERLRAVDPEQANRKRVAIHERLRSIAMEINLSLNKLRSYSNLQSKIQPSLDNLLAEYEEVNQAAERLLLAYTNSLPTTTTKIRILPLGRDEKKIYPFSSKPDDVNSNSEYDYDKNDEVYDDDDDDDDDDDSTTISNEVNLGGNDWDVRIDPESVYPNKDDQTNRPVKEDRTPRYVLMAYLPYIIGGLFTLCVIFGVLIFRFLLQQRRQAHYGNRYEKNYVFTEIDTTTPEDRALHALQANGYENPTYRFFESQTPKC